MTDDATQPDTTELATTGATPIAKATPMVKPGSPPPSQLAQTMSILGNMMTQKGITVEMVREMRQLTLEFARMEADQQLSIAMAAFQDECPMVRRTRPVKYATRKGGEVKYFFAPLEEITATTSPVLHKHGLSIGWGRVIHDNQAFGVCTLYHVGGGSRNAEFPIILDDSTGMSVQKQEAAALSVARRQAVVMVCGLSACDQDWDGCASSPTEPVETITQEEVNSLNDLLIAACKGTSETVDSQRKRLLEKVRVEKMADIPKGKLDGLIATLQKHIVEKRGS